MYQFKGGIPLINLNISGKPLLNDDKKEPVVNTDKILLSQNRLIESNTRTNILIGVITIIVMYLIAKW